jgi:hypothetical protein
MKAINSDSGPVMKIDDLLYRRCTGTAKEFAWEIGVSIRTLHVYLAVMNDFLKQYGVYITYSSKLKSYHYSKPGRLKTFCIWLDDDCEIIIKPINAHTDSQLPVSVPDKIIP